MAAIVFQKKTFLGCALNKKSIKSNVGEFSYLKILKIVFWEVFLNKIQQNLILGCMLLLKPLKFQFWDVF